MTKAEIIIAMLDAAAPVIQSYWTDVRHDARLIAELPDASAFLWGPRAHGTHIVLLSRDESPNERAAELFAAMKDVPQWYYICANMGDFAKVSLDDAAASAIGATRRASDAKRNGETFVSEVHM